MRITEEIAKEVIDRIYPIVGREISIANDQGVVVGSSDPRWIGQTYKEAIEVIKRKEIIEVDPEDGDSGTNFPIFLGSEVIGVLWITGKGENIRDIGKLTSITIELLLRQKFAQTMDNLKKQALDSFIGSFLRSGYCNWEDVASYANILGYDFFLPRFAITIGIPEYGVAIRNALKIMEESVSKKPLRYDVKEKVLSVCRSSPEIVDDDLVAHVSGGLFVILKVEKKCNFKYCVAMEDLAWLEELLIHLEKEMGVKACAGVGPCATTLPDLKVSFKEALSALEIGMLLSKFDNSRIFIYNAPMILLGNLIRSADLKLRGRFVRAILGDVLKRKDLMETLKVYLDSNMNAFLASKRLFIHKNTLFYRLKKIKKITNLDPQKPPSAFFLWLALQMETLNSVCFVER